VQKGSGDNPSKVEPIVVENTYRGLVLGFHRLHLPRSFLGLKSIRGPQLSFGALSFYTLAGFGLNTLLIVVYPAVDCTHLVIVRALAT
jgi:hypothetical protein